MTGGCGRLDCLGTREQVERDPGFECDYQARVPRQGPEEVISLADSFNQMAESLEEQERLRSELIINAAHELRTPLTNLQGYLEALRDGVITPDPEIFASLHEEVDRLVRLSHSLESRDRARGGAGIGLAIVKDLVESAGGRVGLESEFGVTMFWFTLPA